MKNTIILIFSLNLIIIGVKSQTLSKETISTFVNIFIILYITIKIEEYVMTNSAGSSTLEFSRNSVAGEFRTGSEPKLQKRRHHSASNVQSVLQKKIPCRPDKCDADILK
jgi:hypothetical protein